MIQKEKIILNENEVEINSRPPLKKKKGDLYEKKLVKTSLCSKQ